MIMNQQQDETNGEEPRKPLAIPKYKPCKNKHERCGHCDELSVSSLPFYICCACYDLHPRR